MSDDNASVASGFTASLDLLQSQMEELQGAMQRTLQALSQHGVKLSVDLNGMVNNVQRDLRDTRKKSRNVIAELEQQKQLVRTVALITSSLELSQVLDEVMDTVVNLTGAERAYLMLRSRHSDELTIRAARNWDRESIMDDEVNFSRSIVDQALERGEPIITTNAATDGRFAQAQSVMEQGLRSVLCIPLTLHGRTVGVLYADNRLDQNIFNTKDIPLMTAFGTQAAIAIENARMFGQVKDDLAVARRELEELKIQIDQDKVQQQVRDITETAFFDELSREARAMRQRYNIDDQG